MKTKMILIIEGVLLIGILAFLFFLTAPKQLFPLHGMAVSNQDFLFEIENSKEIIISPDEDFANFIILRQGEEITLPPGTYFWKVRGILRDSRVQNFTLVSEASFNLRENGELYEVRNSGNVDLNITKKQNETIVLATIIEIGKSKEFEKDNSTYVGEQTK